MNLNLSSAEVTMFLIALLGIILSAFFGILKLAVGQFEKLLALHFKTFDQRFTSLEKLVTERHANVSTGQQHHGDQLLTLQNQFTECRQRCATSFVTTAEFYETMGPVHKKLENLIAHVINHSPHP